MSLSGVGLLLALSWFPVLFLRTEAAGSCPAAIKSPPYILGLPGVPGPPGPPGALSDTEVKQLEKNLLKDVQKLLFCKGISESNPAVSCKDIYECNPTAPSGRYWLNTSTVPIQVFCDMETDGGGWTVLLKRQDGIVDFYRNWTDYKNGFGNLEGEHWLGLENMYLLTNLSGVTAQLRVDLADWEGNTAFAKYDQFSVGDEDSDYTLSVSGYQNASTAGNSLTSRDSGQRFSTPDRDNDVATTIADGHCAVFFHGPWWHRDCYHSLLTGKYYTSGGPRSSPPYGIIWSSWKGFEYSLRYAEMKIRPGGV